MSGNFNVVEMKIAVLGKTLVGKSALTYQYVNDQFPTDHETTIEDKYTMLTHIEDLEVRLNIIDTAGQDDYQTMIDTWINDSDAFMLVYAINDKESFESIKLRYDRIVKVKGETPFSVVVIGNKCDLENYRKVSREEVEKYCNSLGIEFLECSALEKINIKESFLLLTKESLKKKFPERFQDDEKGKKKKCLCF